MCCGLFRCVQRGARTSHPQSCPLFSFLRGQRASGSTPVSCVRNEGPLHLSASSLLLLIGKYSFGTAWGLSSDSEYHIQSTPREQGCDGTPSAVKEPLLRLSGRVLFTAPPVSPCCSSRLSHWNCLNIGFRGRSVFTILALSVGVCSFVQ